MQIVEKKVSELIPYKNNPRKNDDAVEYVANSIKEFGFKVPIVIDRHNVVVTGHTRLKACQQLGIKTVPCVVADDLTPEQVNAFRLADNKVSEFARWDWDKLDKEIGALPKDFIDVQDFGFKFEIPEYFPDAWNKKFEEDRAERLMESGASEEEIAQVGEGKYEYVADAKKVYQAYNLLELDPADFTGEFDMPRIKACHNVAERFLDFNNASFYEKHAKNAHDFGLRFYQDDAKLDKLWNDPEKWIEVIQRYKCCVMPDFSIYEAMPRAVCLYNMYRRFAIAYIMQKNEIDVVPDIFFIGDDRFASCYDALEAGGYYAISTKGFSGDNEGMKIFIPKLKRSLDRCLERLNPKGIVVFGSMHEDKYDWSKWEGRNVINCDCKQWYTVNDDGLIE